MFDAGLIRKILKNPVYNGKIAFGRRTLEKVHGTRNEYKQVEQDEYLIAEGIHEAIISDELWQVVCRSVFVNIYFETSIIRKNVPYSIHYKPSCFRHDC